jgi:transaldolase
MKQLFIDTANLDIIKKFYSMGIISGVTTNPSLVSKEPKNNFKHLVNDLWNFCASNNLSFSVEVCYSEPSKIIDQALSLVENLLEINNNKNLLYIKVPIGIQEISCIKYLSDQQININCTCGFTSIQMELAALAGAKYLSVFYSRSKEAGIDALETISQIKYFLDQNKLKTEILICSIRNSSDINAVWNSGADIVTCQPNIIENALYHEGSKKAAENFIQDFNKWIN